MDAERILVGTVRGARDGRHIVVRRDGKVSEVIFEGGYRPLIGGDVVGTVRFLCSPQSDYMTGQTVIIDGGMVLQ